MDGSALFNRGLSCDLGAREEPTGSGLMVVFATMVQAAVLVYRREFFFVKFLNLDLQQLEDDG
jgi:hypothetical protein